MPLKIHSSATDLWGGGGRGLQVESLVVSVAALQPSQRPKRSHARANDRRRDLVEYCGFKEVPPETNRLLGIFGGVEGYR